MGNANTAAMGAENWTPQLVRERMLEAVRWARYNAGPTGPAPIRSLMPEYRPSLEDHLAEGWGLPEKADGVAEAEEAERAIRLRLSAARVDQMLWVLDWCRLYLANDRPGDAVILNLWLRCRVHKQSFDGALKARGFALSRQHAYRMRDRACAHIAQGLAREGWHP